MPSRMRAIGVSKTLGHSPSAEEESGKIPALLTRISQRPNSFSRNSRKLITLAAWVTSSWQNLTGNSSLCNFSQASMPFFLSRAVNTTSMSSSFANCRLISKPIPRLAPVTTATLSSLCIYHDLLEPADDLHCRVDLLFQFRVRLG